MSPTRTLRTALCIGIVHQAAAFTPTPQQPRIRTSSSTTAQNAVALPEFSLPNLFESPNSRRSQLKNQILDLASETKRGLVATDDQIEEMDKLFSQLEKLNPTRNPLISAKNKPSVNGDWSLEYTTSGVVLGKGGFPRIGPIVQNIDTTNLTAKNSEVVKYVFVNVPRSIDVELSPVNGQFTEVQFVRFEIGPVGFNVPSEKKETFKGALDITYLDEDFRLTRGDKGNVFVLTRM